MRSVRFAELLRVTVLVAAFAVAQAATLAHSDLDDSHPTDGVCALCVGLASLGTGNVATPPTLDELDRRVECFESVIVLRIGYRAEHRPARGPPLAS